MLSSPDHSSKGALDGWLIRSVTTHTTCRPVPYQADAKSDEDNKAIVRRVVEMLDQREVDAAAREHPGLYHLDPLLGRTDVPEDQIAGRFHDRSPPLSKLELDHLVSGDGWHLEVDAAIALTVRQSLTLWHAGDAADRS